LLISALGGTLDATMRPSPLARRGLDARQLLGGLALVLAALSLLGYWAWQASVRRHQVAIELLRSHAELAAQRLGARMQNELYVAATAVFRPAIDAARDSTARPISPAEILAASKVAAACNCAAPLAPRYAIRTDLTDAGTSIAGPSVPLSEERAALLTALRAQLEDMPNGWDIAVVRSQPTLGGRLVLFTRRRGADGSSGYIGFATDSATLREFVVRPLLCNTPLVVAGDRTHGIPNDSLVALRVAVAAGVELYRT
jgi:hypothetical protein